MLSQQDSWGENCRRRHGAPGSSHEWRPGSALLLILAFLVLAPGLQAREKDTTPYGEGLIVNIPLPVAEVTQAVQDVAENGIIRGTKEYAKDEFVQGAQAVQSTPAFAGWTEAGKVLYKVRNQALDPLGFKSSTGSGTLAVRYVVQPQGESNTVLRIDAVFAEEFRHKVDPSDGTVESSEYRAIQDHLDAIELMKKETADAERAKQERALKKNFGMSDQSELLSTPAGEAGESSSRANVDVPVAAQMPAPVDPLQTPEQRLADLRHQVKRLVKKPGAPLKAAPYQAASTLRALAPGADVLVEILTPYWLGVETRDGQHGWLQRDQLEELP